MKHKLLLIASVFSFGVFAQSSLEVRYGGNLVPANGVITILTDPLTTVKTELDIKNTSNTPKSYYAKRIDVTLNTNGSESAIAYFCFAGKCFGNNVLVSEDPLTLNPGQSASQVSGDFQELSGDLDEIDVVGFSEVRYTFYNAANANDSIQVKIYYNPTSTTGINEVSKAGVLSVYPNPGNGLLNFESSVAPKKIEVINLLGQTVFSRTDFNGNAGKLDLRHLPQGTYYIKMSSERGDQINKVILTR